MGVSDASDVLIIALTSELGTLFYGPEYMI